MIIGIALLGLLLTATTVSADDTILHITGIVTAIDTKHVEVKTPNKKAAVSVKLTKRVQFKDKDNPQSNVPPTVGDRVIIEARKEKKTLTATVVHYSAVRNLPAAAR
jgi:Domain of unknown function (DUF5666)